jgi:hypothetical protein
MNTTKRVKLLREVERLHNMLAASRRPIEEFASGQKQLIDAMLAGIAREAIPANYLKKKPKRWVELRPQDQDRLYKRAFQRAAHDDAVERSLLIRRMVPTLDYEDQAGKVYSDFSHARRFNNVRRNERRFSNNKRPLPAYLGVRPHYLPEGTPQRRLKDKRNKVLNIWRHQFPSDHAHSMGQSEFVPNLHPDDAEWNVVRYDDNNDKPLVWSAVVARDILRLDTLFPARHIMAANLYFDDKDTKSEVYYCAYLYWGRKVAPEVRRGYFGRQYKPDLKKWVVTSAYKTPTGCYNECHAIFNSSMSAILYKEEEAKP